MPGSGRTSPVTGHLHHPNPAGPQLVRSRSCQDRTAQPTPRVAADPDWLNSVLPGSAGLDDHTSAWWTFAVLF